MYNMAKLKNLKAMKAAAPEGMAAFQTFEGAVFKDGALSLKVKELIAVGVAMTTQCVYCIEYHVKKARAAGATDAELTEATLVAAALRAGGAITHGTHAVGD